MAEMIGEFLREAAVLILIFVPIEFYKTDRMSTGVLAVILCFSIVLLAGGILLERLRR